MLDVSRMVSSFASKMDAAFGTQGFDPNDPNFNAFANALMSTIVEEIQANAEAKVDGTFNDIEYTLSNPSPGIYGLTPVPVVRSVHSEGAVS